MGDFGKSMKMPLKYAEINLERTDFRCRVDSPCKVTFAKVKKVLSALPSGIKSVGIGGSPLRFSWWNALVRFLSSLDYSISIVDTTENLNETKLTELRRAKNISVFVEVVGSEDLKFLNSYSSLLSGVLVSFVTLYKHNMLREKIRKLQIEYLMEQPSYIDKEVDISSLSGFLKEIHYVRKACKVANKQVIGFDINGWYYPCIAMRGDDFKLGNIFKDSFSEILANYDVVMSKIKCVYCCQGRSLDQFGVLNSDSLCLL